MPSAYQLIDDIICHTCPSRAFHHNKFAGAAWLKSYGGITR